MKPGEVDVVCLGILVADVLARPVDEVPWGPLAFVEEIALRGGGCALNTASALVRLGVPAAAAGRVGADAFGDFLLRLLDERGVGREGVLRGDTVPTSASVALVSGDGERTFLHVPGANARVRRDELDPEVLFAGRWLDVAGALATTAVGALEGVGGPAETSALAAQAALA